MKKSQNQEMIQKHIRIQDLEKQLQYNESTLDCAVKVNVIIRITVMLFSIFAKTAQREATSPNCVISYVLCAGTLSITEKNTVQPLPIQQSVKLMVLEDAFRVQICAQVKLVLCSERTSQVAIWNYMHIYKYYVLSKNLFFFCHAS